jgi:hypothetical protein
MQQFVDLNPGIYLQVAGRNLPQSEGHRYNGLVNTVDGKRTLVSSRSRTC